MVSDFPRTTTTQFDAAGNPDSRVDAAGRKTIYRFDAARRVTRIGSSTFEYEARQQRGYGPSKRWALKRIVHHGVTPGKRTRAEDATHFHATETMPSEKLSNVLIQYLKRCGESDKRIADCHFGTRLYHDLGIYGEAAEDYLEVLANEYQVEFADFQFDRYFPPEFEGKTAISRALIWNFPYIWKLFRPKVEAGQYLPITLEIIEQVIVRKKWISCPSA